MVSTILRSGVLILSTVIWCAPSLRTLRTEFRPTYPTPTIPSSTIKCLGIWSEKWSWSLSLRLVYPVLQYRRERPSLLDLLSEFGLISDGWLGSISPSGDWANALECWRSPSLRLVIPDIAVSPGVTHSDSHHRWHCTVVKPQHPSIKCMAPLLLLASRSDCFYYDAGSPFFQPKLSGSVGPISTKFSQKPPKPRSLDNSVLRILNFCLRGPGGSKNTQKTANFDMGVQSFGHNSKTNQNIK